MISDRRTTIGVILVSLLATATVLGVHQTGRLSPVFQIGVFALAATVLVVPKRPISKLALGIGLAISARVFPVWFVPGVIGVDPSRDAILIQNLITEGTADVIGLPFYNTAPLHHVLGGVAGVVMGTGAAETMLVFATAVGAVVPLTVFCLVRRCGQPARVAAIGAILAAVGTVTIRFGYRPVPQTTAMLLLLATTLAVAVIRPRDRRLVLLLPLWLGALYTVHKLALLLAALILTVSVGHQWIVHDRSDRHSTALLSLALVIVVWQFASIPYLTSTLVAGLVRVASDLGISSGPAPDFQTPTDAIGVGGGTDRYLIHIYAPILLASAGLSWLYLFLTRRDRDRPTALLLAAAAVTVALALLFVVAPTQTESGRIGSPLRLLLFASPFCVALVAVALGQARSWRLWRPALSVVVVALLLSGFVFAPYFVPDSSQTPRYYLTEGEQSAKAFADDVPSEVATDSMYIRKSADLDREENPNVYQTEGYTTLGASLFNADLDNEEAVLYRSQDIYFVGSGPWRSPWMVLTYDPEPQLNSQFDRLYDGGDAQVFNRSVQR